MTTEAGLFWRKVDKKEKTTEDCWMWLAGVTWDRYGKFQRNGQATHAHRVAYELVIGQIPEGYYLHHKCGKRLCVNPYHLELLTPKEHTRLHKAILTVEQIKEIRERYAAGGIFQRQLAREYGVTQPQISMILSGKRWRD